MTPDEYIEAVLKTESAKYIIQKPRIVHGIVGCVTEAGEMMDTLKRATFYGEELNIFNLKEEIGDMFWYLAVLCNELGVTFEQIQERNIEKLKTRYPNSKFSKTNSDNRDYEKENKAVRRL